MSDLQQFHIKLINTGSSLEDYHIDGFLKLVLKHYSNYTPLLTSQLRSSYEIPAQNKHIQLIFRHFEDEPSLRHWICTYYDSKDLFIFDSSNSKEINSDHKKILQALHPYLFSNAGHHSIYFPTVQSHVKAADSGVFAIAFASSVLFDLKPNMIEYDESLMRLHLIKMFEKNVIEHFPFQFLEVTLEKLRGYRYEEQRINEGLSLRDCHISYLQQLIKHCSYYQPQDPVYVVKLFRVKEIPQNQKHIQILFQEPPPGGDIGHWVCSYYDTKSIKIYDSLNSSYLDKDFEKYLFKLHGYCFKENRRISFPKVQSQHGLDCGYFAAMFAVSILFGLEPNNLYCDEINMKDHLRKILHTRILKPYPTIQTISESCNLLEKNIIYLPLPKSNLTINKIETFVHSSRRKFAPIDKQNILKIRKPVLSILKTSGENMHVTPSVTQMQPIKIPNMKSSPHSNGIIIKNNFKRTIHDSEENNDTLCENKTFSPTQPCFSILKAPINNQVIFPKTNMITDQRINALIPKIFVPTSTSKPYVSVLKSSIEKIQATPRTTQMQPTKFPDVKSFVNPDKITTKNNLKRTINDSIEKVDTLCKNKTFTFKQPRFPILKASVNNQIILPKTKICLHQPKNISFSQFVEHKTTIEPKTIFNNDSTQVKYASVDVIATEKKRPRCDISKYKSILKSLNFELKSSKQQVEMMQKFL